MTYPWDEQSKISSFREFDGLGKIPPQAPELEEAVLGALLIENKATDRIVDVLKPHHFYKDAHSTIYEAILELYEEGKEIDLLTITERMRKKEKLEFCGGAYYLTQLTVKVVSTIHLEAHTRIILEKYVKRALINAASDIQRLAYEDSSDSFNLLQEAEIMLINIIGESIARDAKRIRESYKEYLLKVERIQQLEVKLSGVPCGMIDVDRVTQGWQNSDFIVMASRPGMGKTALGLQMARNISIDFNMPIAFFSLEMSTEQLVARLVAVETGISTDRQRVGDVGEWNDLLENTSKLAEAPIYIDDSAAISIVELRAKTRRLVGKHGVKMIFVDYLQLMRGTGKKEYSREQEIANISRGLKALAKELDVPVLALAQLSRKVEERTDKRPILSDLRESGSIEQDADVVFFLFRDDYYTHEESQVPGEVEIIIEKNRNGKTGRVKLKFKSETTKFVDFVNLTAADEDLPF